jgi:hypothetical protein
MTTIELYWVSSDGQSSLDGGAHAIDVDREAEEVAFRRELLTQCSSAGERDEILAGRMVWREVRA